MLCEPDEYEITLDARGRRQETVVRGITHTAQQIIDHGDYSLSGLVSRFVRKHGLNELSASSQRPIRKPNGCSIR